LPSACFFQIDGVVSPRDSTPSACRRKKSLLAILIPTASAISYTPPAPRWWWEARIIFV
jgi:hypothetical protein